MLSTEPGRATITNIKAENYKESTQLSKERR